MKREHIHLQAIPAIIWGEPSDRAYIYAHGRYGNKEEAEFFAEIAEERGYQVISFDLPQHGERKDDAYPCSVQNGVRDFKILGNYSSRRWKELSFCGSSLGAYFGLVSYRALELDRCLLISPILDMERLIRNMMAALNVSEDELSEKQEIPTPFGETLSWPYYAYVKEHRIEQWEPETHILWGTRDHLTAPEVVRDFCERFHCGLKVMDGAEHYFQESRHLQERELWLESHIPIPG